MFFVVVIVVIVVVVVVVVVIVIVVVVLHHSKALLQKNKDFSQHTYHNPRQGITNQEAMYIFRQTREGC